MTEKIVLLNPQKIFEKQAEEYIKEFWEHGSEIHGASKLDRFVERGDYSVWLAKIGNHGEGLAEEGYVPADTYFAVREADDKIVGMTNIRHIFDGDLADTEWSHIGYAVRPSERRKGYATEILRLALIECAKLGLTKVLVTCDKNNTASEKTILRNGGIFIDEVKDGDETTKRYWISL